jgi:hypothetical protein
MFRTSVVEKIKTHCVFRKVFFPENRAVYDMMWKKCCTAGEATEDDIIRRMRFACWITKAYGGAEA